MNRKMEGKGLPNDITTSCTPKSMADSNSFLQKIIDKPELDEPRLIYADWLMDHDDPRGELIAIQCELAKMDDEDERLPALERRQNELLYKNAKNWRLNVEQPQRFHRGFVGSIQCPKYQAAATAQMAGQTTSALTPRERERQRESIPRRLDQLCERTPITKIINWDPEFNGSHVNRIRQLVYPGRFHEHTRLKDEFLALENWPPHLTELSLTGISLRNLIATNGGQRLKRLSKLTLGSPLLGPVGDETGPQALCEQLSTDLLLSIAIGWGNFQLIGRWLNSIGSRQLKLVVPGTSWPVDINMTGTTVPFSSINLRELHIRGVNEICTNAPGLILNLDWAPHVKTLTLDGQFRWSIRSPLSSLKHREAVQTIETLNFITHLDLPGSERYPMEEWAAPIADLDWRSLRRLKIRATNAIWPEPKKNPVTKLLQNPPQYLRRLDLSYCHMTDRDVIAILKSPGIKQLTHLNLRRNRLSNSTIDELCQIGPWPNLVAIDLRKNSHQRVAKLKETFGTRMWNIES